MTTYKQPTGVVLDDSELGDPDLQSYARGKLPDIRVFVATEPDGTKSYVVYEKSEPVYTSQQMLAVADWIDRQWLMRSFDEKEATGA